ncbi:carboxylate-amine ligase [Planobispora rosea]|uniref:carboxylate-amine ligase n=1 Tax=Planobispora rosea TaxID=35762 RepID=UPI00083A2D85|nr:glutamate--cysteine ligase [Planobispora rosea]
MEVPPMGVEEEFFLLEPHTGQTVPAVEQILAGIGSHELLQREIATCQIETATHPHTDLAALRRQLTGLRAELAGAARQAGCRLAACGTAPLEHSASDAPLTDDARYRRIAHAYGATCRGEKCCGCHVHIEVPEREEAVQVGNHLRPWLPTLLALTANSPFTAGGDSGYASWRAMTWGRWPSAALPPYLQDAAEHRMAVESLIGSGAILDEGMLYWLVRPSHHLPTVEVRVADVCATADEAALFAAIVRGLVTSVLSDIRAGRPAPRPPETLLEAAYWRAARDGLEGQGLDLITGALVPAWHLVEALLARITAALETAGDLGTVRDGLARLRVSGSGAVRQRAIYAQRRAMGDVVAWLSRQSAGEVALAAH